MIRTVIIDDEELLRSGLRMLLGADERIDVVGEAADGRVGLELISREKPDVVLLDLRMPALDGVGVLEELRGWINPPKVLVLTAFDTDDLVRAALAAGTVGFLVKSSAPDVLAEAIVATHAGRSVLSPGVLERVVKPAQGDSAQARPPAR
ncbi:response regulator [Corynebacterium cystitidis]|uniref:response regulator n=1 Tax=Corynebacterium cystitidis TaxID=35757 RepID=UPI00211E349D|nr:response regulator transcription factor [Corynebacterium cystitidis]